MPVFFSKVRSVAGVMLRTSVLVACFAFPIIGLPLSSASAQARAVLRDGATTNYYYQLPDVVRITPGTMRILRSRCAPSYPMDEFMPCDTATGGPVGGRGP